MTLLKRTRFRQDVRDITISTLSVDHRRFSSHWTQAGVRYANDHNWTPAEFPTLIECYTSDEAAVLGHLKWVGKIRLLGYDGAVSEFDTCSGAGSLRSGT